MRLLIMLFVAIILSAVSCDTKSTKVADSNSGCSDDCKAKSKDSTKIACKLTTPELRERKETVLARLKSQVIEKKELKDGYAFKFDGSDKMLDELTEFIKTERACCDFFTFNLSIAGDKNTAWLELTGAEGAKEFIGSELGL
jgi:hypothetical protein